MVRYANPTPLPTAQQQRLRAQQHQLLVRLGQLKGQTRRNPEVNQN